MWQNAKQGARALKETMRTPRLFISSVVLLAFCSVAYASKSVEVPLAKAPEIDGTIRAEEWKGAARFELVNGGELFIQSDGVALYIAIRGDADGWSHVYLGDESSVRVLHASAALGEVKYQKTAETWEAQGQFSWEMRNFSARNDAEKDDFYQKHGWIANTVNRGREREYRISRAALAGRHIAVVYAADPASPRYWPPTLRDDTLATELVRGNLPPKLTFQLQTHWAELKLPNQP
jgi:hypothetical protein